MSLDGGAMKREQAINLAKQAGAAYTVDALGRPRVFMLSPFELQKLIGLARETAAQHCDTAAATWKDADHRRAATILAHGIRAMGKA